MDYFAIIIISTCIEHSNEKNFNFLYNDYSCQFVEIGLVVPNMPFYYLAISKLP